MKGNHQQIEELITPIVEAMGYRVWHIDIHQVMRKTLLRIYIDLPVGDERKSISLDECSKISKQIGALLDVENPALANYTLEISSPGLNRSLYTSEHYRQYLGSEVRIVLKQSENGRLNFKGRIEGVADNSIKVKVADELVTFSLTNINKANLIPEL